MLFREATIASLFSVLKATIVSIWKNWLKQQQNISATSMPMF
jgi:hypothetical protein